ncbi:hypothetical protein ABT010_35750 [Streptomyces sp. NPDC002668]|uniref:hypothetical protein n=1 Tax=Streptomyces sp. NPDC002668 TaxID=3154422 RepID=UPI00332919ED
MTTPSQPPRQYPGPYAPPAQQPYAHHAAPQHPYGRPGPYPQFSGSWVQPQPTKRTGRVAGIFVGSLAQLGALGYALFLVLNAAGVADGDWPKATHQLTVPKTLLGGKYALARDSSKTKGQESLKDLHDHRIRGHAAITATYSGGASGSDALTITALHGQIREAKYVRREMVQGLEEPSEGNELLAPPKDITPAGSGVTLSCAVMNSYDDKPVSTPACAWADGSTTATVLFASAELDKQRPENIDLSQYAELTVKVRAQTRQPIS